MNLVQFVLLAEIPATLMAYKIMSWLPGWLDLVFWQIPMILEFFVALV